jgi:hypothetical protein
MESVPRVSNTQLWRATPLNPPFKRGEVFPLRRRVYVAAFTLLRLRYCVYVTAFTLLRLRYCVYVAAFTSLRCLVSHFTPLPSREGLGEGGDARLPLTYETPTPPQSPLQGGEVRKARYT